MWNKKKKLGFLWKEFHDKDIEEFAKKKQKKQKKTTLIHEEGGDGRLAKKIHKTKVEWIMKNVRLKTCWLREMD